VSTEPHDLTLAEAVRRAAEAVDPQGGDDRIADLVLRFEDRDEPIRALDDVEELMAETTRSLDVEEDDPALTLTGAVVTYLRFRTNQADDDPERLLELAIDAEFKGSPPPKVVAYLDGRDTAGA
jgi:hypothetical protein